MSERVEKCIAKTREAWNGQKIPSAPANTLAAIEVLAAEVDELRRMVEAQRVALEAARISIARLAGGPTT
jgi:hypothetical protein